MPQNDKFIRFSFQTSDNRYYIEYSSDRLTWTLIDTVVTFSGLDPEKVTFVIGSCFDGGLTDEEFNVKAVYTDAIKNEVTPL